MVGKEPNSKKRDPLFDVVKFVAIFLVVMGHVFSKGCVDSLPTWFWNFRDEMTMPLFFIISAGMSKADILLYPIKRILFAGWFVWVLSFAYVIAFLMFRLRYEEIGSVIAILLCISIGLYFLPEMPRGACHVHYLPLMFPFFAAGILWRKLGHLKQIGDSFNWEMIGILCFAVYCIVALIVPASKFGLSMYSGQTYGIAWLTSSATLIKTGARILVGLIGSFGTIAVINCLIQNRKFASLAHFGTTTLGVYLLHQWLIDQMVDLHILPGGFFLCSGVAILLFLICHFLVVLSKRYQLANTILWGHNA